MNDLIQDEKILRNKKNIQRPKLNDYKRIPFIYNKKFTYKSSLYQDIKRQKQKQKEHYRNVPKIIAPLKPKYFMKEEKIKDLYKHILTIIKKEFTSYLK